MPDSGTPAAGEQFEATPVEGQGGQAEVSDIGSALLRTEESTQIPVTSEDAVVETRPEGWEPDPDKAHYEAAARDEEETAASVARSLGRTEKASEFMEQADAAEKAGTAEYYQDQARERSKLEVELRIAENEQRAEQERRRRFEEELNALIDKVLEAINLEPGQTQELLDDFAWPEGYGSQPKIEELYRRLKIQRPSDSQTPDYEYDASKGGPSMIVGTGANRRQVSESKYFRTPTQLGVVVTETRYKPGHQYNEGPRILLAVVKDKPETTGQ